VWYIVLSAIAAATLINVVSKLWAWKQLWARRKNLFRRSQPITTPSGQTKGVSLRRIPAAILTASRIVAFRWRILMGKSYSMSILEVFIALTYLAALLTHEFVHSMYSYE
jgi:ferric-chelate reductase